MSVVTKDFLGALPVEIWDRIISETFLPLEIMTIPEEVRTSPAHHLRYDIITDAQKELFTILQACKGLGSLVEPKLYRKAYIDGQAAYNTFITSAKSKSLLPQKHQDEHRGERTTALFIWEDLASAGPNLEVDLEDISAACPNLAYLEIDGREGMEELSWGVSSWISRLHSVSLATSSLRWEDLRQLATHCPQLRDLKIGFCEGDSCDDPITFPALEHFGMSEQFLTGFDVSKLDLPAIKGLYAKVMDRTQLRTIISSHGRSITALEITKALPFFGMGEPMNVSSKLFGNCPRLQRLSFEVDAIKPMDVTALKEAAKVELKVKEYQHKKLSHLELSMNSMDDMSALKGHADFFSKETFPNLSSVSISVPENPSFEICDSFYDAAEKLFPKMKLEYY